MRGKKYLWMLFILLLSTIVLVPIYAQHTNEHFWVEPAVKPGEDVGTFFNVEVWVENAWDMVGWAMSVHVDPDVLEVLGASEGPFISDFVDAWNAEHPSDPISSDFHSGILDKTGGYIKWTDCMILGFWKIPVGEAANGTGMLCKYWFKSKSETAYSPIDLFDVSVFDHIQELYIENVTDGHYSIKYPPVAVITAPTEGYVNEEVTFIGAYSYDPDGGAITSYQWDFGDGTTSTEQNPTHTYTLTGTYNVTLVVTDDEEEVSEPAEHTIIIRQALRPVAVIKAPEERYVKETVTFDGSDSYDPDGGAIVGYLWDFGDGTTSTEQNPMHTYTSNRTYEVTLVVTDDEEQESDPATHIIKIKSPIEGIQELIETIKSWNLPEGTENSLTSKLEEAVHLLSMSAPKWISNPWSAKQKLLDFIDQVEALRSKGKMEDWQADYLIAEAQRIIDIIW